MALRIRQIVLVAEDLESSVDALTSVFGLRVCYRDPGVAEFGLENALMAIGDQFLEVVAPMQSGTAAGRHLERHGDSGYMLLLQTDNFKADRARFEQLAVRTIWESKRSDIDAVHLHPKDIGGGAIVSVDQPQVAADWPWAGPDWRSQISDGVQRVESVMIGARDPAAMAARWAEVLGTAAPQHVADAVRVALQEGELLFRSAAADCITGFGFVAQDREAILQRAKDYGLTIVDDEILVGGARFSIRSH